MAIECEHGQLARSCSICALEAELTEVIAQRDKLLASALAPSAPDGWRPFLTDVITAAGLLTHGKRDKRLAERIGSFAFDAMRTSAPTPPEVEPALVVETEPGYWHRGHYCEGTKSYIDPTKVWGLPVGTKLYTAPSAPSVPETEPVAYATGYYAGCLSIATIDGRVLPAGTALYAAPPHQSEQHLEMVNTPAPSVPDWQGWAMRLIDFIEGAEVSSGVCCCGDDMARHASPINCGHSPVDMWDNCVKNLRAEFDKFVAAPTQPEPPAELPTWENGDDPLVGGGLISRGVVDFATVGTWPTKPAPSVPDGWRSAIAKEFPLYDEGEIDEDKHCCEWVMLQERKRLHKMLEATPPPPKLSDERIFDLLKQVDPHAVRLPLGFKQFAIAIEREILGGGE